MALELRSVPAHTSTPPRVSVICLTYNHAAWIRQCLEGFLIQRAPFPVEIIVHDDASTDGTAEIVREFAIRYPGRIRAILQRENQYSRGVKVLAEAWREARAPYLAFCEGDDAWVDSDKLRRQVDALERHPDCRICLHPVWWTDAGSEKQRRGPSPRGERIIPAESFVRQDFDCPTASLMIRREVLEELPDWFYHTAPVSDYYLALFAAIPAGAVYLDRPMALYRYGHESSWTRRQQSLRPLLRSSRRYRACFRLLRESLPSGLQPALAWNEARFLHERAASLARAGRFGYARLFIARSWQAHPRLHWRQTLFYHLRYCSAILRLIFILR